MGTQPDATRIGIEGSVSTAPRLPGATVAAGKDVRGASHACLQGTAGRDGSRSKSDRVDAVTIARVAARDDS